MRVGHAATQVPLSAFTHFESATAPLAVNHQGQFPAVTLSFNLAPGASLGEAVKAIETGEKEIGMPPSIQASFQGTAQAFQSFAGERAAADSGGAGDGVHRAGRAVRELHSSDHDSFDAALGRRGRDSGAAAVARTI